MPTLAPAERDPGLIVVALGGNAIARFGDDGTVATQYRRAAEAMRDVADLCERGNRLVLTHGNGPVVGNIVLRGELANHHIPRTPLFIASADSEGGIGLMLQQVLGNELAARGSDRLPATIVTQVVVDSDDPAFTRPDKPIGPYFSAGQAKALATQHGWDFAEEPGKGWRRVVASPLPKRVVELDAVTALLTAGLVPIAAGGGGVPVVESSDGLEGVDAVIDKDRTAALLARSLSASMLLVMMEADALYEDFGTERARRMDVIDAASAAAMAPALPAGGMRPKVEAAAALAVDGIPTILCTSGQALRAMEGGAGTRIVP